MAEGGARPKRQKAGAKLKDIINNLVHDSDSESDQDEFQESLADLEHVGGENADSILRSDIRVNTDDDDEVKALEKKLQTLKLERRKRDLHRAILAEKQALGLQLEQATLQQTTPHTGPAVTVPSSTEGEPFPLDLYKLINLIKLPEKAQKALQIVDYVWTDIVPQYHTYNMGQIWKFGLARKNPLTKLRWKNGDLLIFVSCRNL